MKFRDAVNKCPDRGYIVRPNGYIGNVPPGFKFIKKHNSPLECRVAIQDQIKHDWECFEGPIYEKREFTFHGTTYTQIEEAEGGSWWQAVHQGRGGSTRWVPLDSEDDPVAVDEILRIFHW